MSQNEQNKEQEKQNEQNKEQEKLIKWMDEDMSNSLLKNTDQMLMLIRGCKNQDLQKNNVKMDLDYLWGKFSLLIYYRWGMVVSDNARSKEIGDNNISNCLGNLLSEDSHSKQFQTLLKTLIRQVLIEDKEPEDALVKKWEQSNAQGNPKNG